jgi:hypothetical protein
LRPDEAPPKRRNSLCRFALFHGDSGTMPPEEHEMPRVENGHVVETTTEARAGVTGHNVRYVLLIGTLAVIVLFTIAYVATKW